MLALAMATLVEGMETAVRVAPNSTPTRLKTPTQTVILDFIVSPLVVWRRPMNRCVASQLPRIREVFIPVNDSCASFALVSVAPNFETPAWCPTIGPASGQALLVA